jgi:hypothetical protein
LDAPLPQRPRLGRLIHMPRTKELSFSGTVVRLDSGMRYHAVPVPGDIAEKLRASGSRRVLATINGQTFSRGLMNHAEGDSYILLGGDLLKTCGLRVGSKPSVTLAPDPKPDALDMPECFTLVLEQDAEARVRWETFPVGRRRSLLHYILSAKQESTRIRRSWELAEKIRTRSLHGDKT